MASYVTDTQAVVWHLLEPRRLSRAAKRAFAAFDSGRWHCFVPAICFAEIALLNERGRIRFGAARILETLAGHPGYSVLALDVAQAVEFSQLPALKDPMDRLILAAARVTSSRLVSCDEALDGHGVERVWD